MHAYQSYQREHNRVCKKKKNKEKTKVRQLYIHDIYKFDHKLEDDAHGDFGAYVSVSIYIFIICM